MKKLLNGIVAWMMAHPTIEHMLEAALWAGVVAMVGYCKTTGQFEAGAAGLAFVKGLLMYYQANKNLIVAQLQDQLQALQNLPTGTSNSDISRIVNAVPVPKSSALSPILRASVVVLALMFLVGPAFAWQEPSAAFQSPNQNNNLVRSSFGTNTETDLVLIQTSSLGYSVTSQVPVYGISGGYDLLLAQDTGTQDGAHVTVVPLLGVGIDAFIDVAPLINQSQAPLGLLGFNALGPDISHFINIAGIQDVVPAANFLWNLNDGSFVTTIGLRAPLGIFANDGVKKVAGPF
ncbi:MAG TPA: hypothetical protein VMT55_01685 [Candidatus Sulfotelmatobacter sp.]|nr:hypothetical protein [Candidatus Sulfotelmatobacter sp.]